jgi:hypothetical protein
VMRQLLQHDQRSRAEESSLRWRIMPTPEASIATNLALLVSQLGVRERCHNGRTADSGSSHG